MPILGAARVTKSIFHPTASRGAVKPNFSRHVPPGADAPKTLMPTCAGFLLTMEDYLDTSWVLQVVCRGVEGVKGFSWVEPMGLLTTAVGATP